jgi:WD40 repeat protein
MLHAHHEAVTALAMTPDGKQATSSSYSGPVRVWNLEDGRMLEESFEAVPGRLRDQTLQVSDLDLKVREVLEGYGVEVTAVAMTPDGDRAISGDSSGRLRVWDLNRWFLSPRPEGHGDIVYAVAVTPDGKRAVSSSRDRSLKVWDLEAGCVEATLPDQDSEATSVAITPDGERAIWGSLDGTLKVWNLNAGVLEASLEGHDGEARAVAITPDGTRAVSACVGEVKAWDIASAECTLSSNDHPVGAVAIAPDGGRAYLGLYNCYGDPGTVRFWDIPTNRLVTELQGGVWHISAVSVSPNAKWAALRSDRGPELVVWNLETSRLVATFDDGADDVRKLGVAPDGECVISGSRTGRLKIWHSATRQCHASFDVEAGVTALAPARHGVVVAGDSSGAVHILQCLSAVDEAEADRVLNAVERKIRGQIATFRGYVIANRTAGSVCRMAEASSLLFRIAFALQSNDEEVGIAAFAGYAVIDGFPCEWFHSSKRRFQLL